MVLWLIRLSLVSFPENSVMNWVEVFLILFNFVEFILLTGVDGAQLLEVIGILQISIAQLLAPALVDWSYLWIKNIDRVYTPLFDQIKNHGILAQRHTCSFLFVINLMLLNVNGILRALFHAEPKRIKFILLASIEADFLLTGTLMSSFLNQVLAINRSLECPPVAVSTKFLMVEWWALTIWHFVFWNIELLSHHKYQDCQEKSQ